jgi:hypothetical protein
MPFNGSGTFTRLRRWVNDAAASVPIRPDYHDDEDDNLAQGLSQCITKDGQTTVTANLPMATYRHTNVGAATAVNQYARYDQMQLGRAVWAVAGGSPDALTATYSPVTTVPVDGQLYFVRAGAANATATPTFSPDGNVARTITKNGDQPLLPGDISGAGHELILRYRLADTKYELLNPAYDPTQLGTAAFLNAGTASGEVPTNSDLGAAAFEDVASGGTGDLLREDGDGSQLTGLPLVKKYLSGELTITAGGELILTHGLGKEPELLQAKLICKTANLNYPIGAVVYINTGVTSSSASRSAAIYTDNATEIKVRFGDDSQSFVLPNKNTGVATAITNSSWRLIITAFA